MIHELKIWQAFYGLIKKGQKTFEIRRNDRNYKVGDMVIFKEWDTTKVDYTGRECERKIIYIQYGFGLRPGHVVLGLERIK